MCGLFFFKQKTAYEMRISDWSSDVCSSDLIILGPEMRSTGEVMGIDRSFERAFAKSQLGAGVVLPENGTVFVSVKDADKAALVRIAGDVRALGLKLDRKSTRLNSSR